MTNASQTETTKGTKLGFKAPCIRCGQLDGVHLFLSNVATFHCSQCDEEWTGSDVHDLMDQWYKVLSWTGKALVELSQ